MRGLPESGIWDSIITDGIAGGSGTRSRRWLAGALVRDLVLTLYVDALLGLM